MTYDAQTIRDAIDMEDDGLFEKRAGDLEEMKRGLLTRIEAIREGI